MGKDQDSIPKPRKLLLIAGDASLGIALGTEMLTARVVPLMMAKPRAVAWSSPILDRIGNTGRKEREEITKLQREKDPSEV